MPDPRSTTPAATTVSASTTANGTVTGAPAASSPPLARLATTTPHEKAACDRFTTGRACACWLPEARALMATSAAPEAAPSRPSPTASDTGPRRRADRERARWPP